MKQTILTLILTAGFSAQAFADNLISTLGQPYEGAVNFGETTRFFATDFLTGPDATTLTLATMNVRANDSIAHSLHIEIWSDASGAPASLWNAFDTPISILPNSDSYTNYTASDPGISLAANTIYWLVFRVGESSVILPIGQPSVNITPGQDVNLGGLFAEVAASDFKVSYDGGASWSYNGTDTPAYQLEGTAVPEPGACALMLSGIAAISLRRRRSPGNPTS